MAQLETKEDDEKTSVPSELLPPQKTLQDILCDAADCDEKKLAEALKYGRAARKESRKQKVDVFAVKPSMIIQDWLFLGDARNAFRLDLLLSLGITHILNVSREVPNYHLLNRSHRLRYAQLRVDDAHGHNSLYDYLDATRQFLDECNPRTSDGRHKVLVHCARGKSRSSTVGVYVHCVHCL